MIPIDDAPIAAADTFRCPYTEACRAQGLATFAEQPELAIVFSRPQCGERDAAKALRCAGWQGLTGAGLPKGRIEL